MASSFTTTLTPCDPSSYSSKFLPSESTDITFRSADDVYFALHRKNLETHAEAFPGPEVPMEQAEVIDLTETSDILVIVFDFMYPRRQADIEQMEFQIVSEVAEAVEKYQIFSAFKVCEMRLKQLIPTNAAEVLAHGIKHDYPSLVNGALPYLARKPLVQVLERLPPQYYLDFCRYHETWNQVFKDTMTSTILDPGEDLSQIFTRIFQWEAIENVLELQRVLTKDAEPVNVPNCQRCRQSCYGSNNVNIQIQKVAVGCLGRIKGMDPFSG